ncbi:cytochrome P450 [Singulisphaera sp. PoT]|uniref:cytochrome P450 n=1 Tax=Singulisphaera sp. PoT TaxID=3411797 RepID=UPI003BF52B52
MAVTTTEPLKKSPPGPKGHWFFGSGREFQRDRLGFLEECSRTYGDVVSFRLAHHPIIVVNHPDQIEEVLVTNNKHYIKHFALRMTKSTLGNGLLTSEGEFWRRQRRLSQPAFHRERIAASADMMVAFTERMLEGWRDGQTRDIQNDMMQVTLQIVAKALFDADVSGESADASEAMEFVLRCFTARVGKIIRLPEFIPTPVNIRLRRAIKSLDSIIFRVIEERRASGADRGDLLSMLLQAHDEDDGGGMTDRQLRDELMTLFMAGHETTANTLGWALYLISLHPEVESRLHAELDSVLGDRLPTLSDLPKLPYTENVISETLRLYPTVWLLGREAIVPTEVGGYPVPVGTTIYMSQWVLHRDPRFFDDPLSYRPERWENQLSKRIPRYAYFPFGGGPRICIGNTFALMESALILATIARRFRLSLSPGAKITPLPTMTLRADGGIPMVVEAR